MRTIYIIALVNLAALVACTAPSEDGGGGGARADGAIPSTTPAELAGTAWTWTTSAGAQRLGFGAAGGYTRDVLVDAHPGEACGTEYYTHRAGVATFAGANVTLTSTMATGTKVDSCSDKTLEDVEVEHEASTYGWRLNGAETLVLVDEQGDERSYTRE